MNRRAQATQGEGFGDGLAGRPAVHADAAYQQGWRVGREHRRDLYAGLPFGTPSRAGQRPRSKPDTPVRVGVAAWQ